MTPKVLANLTAVAARGYKGGAIGNALPLMQGIAPSQPQSVSLNGFSMKRQVESLDLHLAFHSQTKTAVDDFKDEQ